MATASQVAKSSLGWILVKDAVAPLNPSDVEDFMFAMNNYMLALDGEGVTLGYTPVSSPSDEVTVPATVLRGVIANMAVELAPSYDAVVTPGLQQIAINGLKQMRIIGQSIGPTRYPSTLPIGSGNENDSGVLLNSHFYDQDIDLILAESTGYIGLETSTNTVLNNDS